MFRILKKSLKTGIVTGRYQETAPREASVPPEADQKARPFRRSLTIREVDTGSCNACEMEMNALMNPIYDAERFGVHIAASPRHADALVVTGPVTVNMEKALKDAYRTAPGPELVIALRGRRRGCGMFKGRFGVPRPVERHVPVDVRIHGCPPRPAEILNVLQRLRGRDD